MTQEERWVEALSQSAQIVVDLNEALKFECDWNSKPSIQEDNYRKATKAIVEPELGDEDSDAYGEFIEEDTVNWAGFIRRVLGEEWGKIADKVLDIGY